MVVLTVEAKRFVIAACLKPPCRLADVQLGAGPHINGCHEVVCSAQREKECREKDQHGEAARRAEGVRRHRQRAPRLVLRTEGRPLRARRVGGGCKGQLMFGTVC
jgi:hypothetical protein